MFSAFEMLGTLICLLLAVGFGQSTTTKFRDPRPMYPSLKTLMLPENQIYSVFNVNSFNPSELQQPKGLVSTSSGMTYLEFYANDQCSGDVTYSTGYREGLCLPSNDYVRPPLTDEDDFYYKYPFQSLSIHNVTASCDGWYITYYTDVNCSDVYDVTRIEHYTDCRSSSSLKVSNMQSVLGKCTFSSDLPILSDSYIISDYTGKNGCTQQELVSYIAYGFHTCFGYGNFSSTMFMPNASAGSVLETQFYSSTNCTRSGSEYGQSDYVIPTGTCNPVQSPNSPSSDDDVAYTEYIGLSMVVTPAPAVPSANPSAQPTALPTSEGSATPTQNDLVLFSAQQVITGIDINTYNSNTSIYSLALKESIGACMTGVSSSNILNLQVTGVASAAARQDTTLFVHTLRLASSSQVNAAYEVSVHDASLSYDSLSQELSTAVKSGQFDTYLSTYGAQTGAVGFVGATSTAVTTDNEESGDGNDDKNGFTSGEIAGIVIGSVAVLLVLFTCGYFLGKHRTAQRSPSMVPPAGNRNNIPSLVSPNRNSNSNMEEGGATTTNPLATAKK